MPTMQIDKVCQLFFGRKIDGKLREALTQAKLGDRRYFEDADFLRVISVGEEEWIGKIVKPGVDVGDVEDIQRNVVSILRRIAPTVRPTSASIKIFALRSETLDLPASPSSTGPYIVG